MSLNQYKIDALLRSAPYSQNLIEEVLAALPEKVTSPVSFNVWYMGTLGGLHLSTVFTPKTENG